MAAIESPEKLGLKPFDEFDEANETWPRGDRPAAIREAAAEFRARFATPENRVRGIRTVDIASAGYPLKFAFGGAATAPNPYINIINRLAGRPVRGLRRRAAHARLRADGHRGPAGGALLPADDRAHPALPAGPATSSPTRCSRRSGTRSPSALAETGLRPEDVDFVSFDHLHVQDVRFVLGSTDPPPGHPEAAAAAVPEREAADPAHASGTRSPRSTRCSGPGTSRTGSRASTRTTWCSSTATSSSARASPWSGRPATPTATTRSASTPRTASGSRSENGVSRRLLAPAPLEDPGRAQVRGVLRPRGDPQLEHPRGLDRPVRLDGQGEGARRPQPPRPPLPQRPSLLGDGRLEAPMAGACRRSSTAA